MTNLMHKNKNNSARNMYRNIINLL